MLPIVLGFIVFIAPGGQAVGGRTVSTYTDMETCQTAAAQFGTRDAGNDDGVVAIMACGVLGAKGEPA